MPEAPTLIELGYPDNPTCALLSAWWRRPARRAAIIDRIREETARIIADPEFRKRHMIDRGLAPIADLPDQFAAFLATYRAAAAHVIKESGIEPQ